MTLHVGTSGYAYKEWKGTFYPEKLPQKAMLGFYGENFNAVEINNTFYRMPKESVLLQWAEEVPADFSFVLKASRRITHFTRLKPGDDELDYFLSTANVLRKQLGPTLFQLPPNLKKDTERLSTFLKRLPKSWKAAFEFRHASWFDEEVTEVLTNAGAALVFAQTDEEPEPMLARTTNWGYLRLRKVEYSDDDLKQWVDHIRGQDWSNIFVFFKHEDSGTGPALAKRFLALTDR